MSGRKKNQIFRIALCRATQQVGCTDEFARYVREVFLSGLQITSHDLARLHPTGDEAAAMQEWGLIFTHMLRLIPKVESWLSKIHVFCRNRIEASSEDEADIYDWVVENLLACQPVNLSEAEAVLGIRSITREEAAVFLLRVLDVVGRAISLLLG